VSDRDLELLRRYDGAERIERLPLAQFVTLAPSADPDEPVDVTIEWGPTTIEKPLPGSSLWRAVLSARLEQPLTADPAESIIRSQIKSSVERFPDLETWWAWLRTGWTAPPKAGERALRNGPRWSTSTGWPWS
jgi:hypothetical protein